MSTILTLLTVLARLFILIYCGFKFATGEKEDISTLYYGVWIILAFVTM